MANGALNIGLEGKAISVALLSPLEQFGCKRSAQDQPRVETKAEDPPNPSSSAVPSDD